MKKLILVAAISALVSGVAFADRNAPSVENTAIKSFNTSTETVNVNKSVNQAATGYGANANNGGTAQGGAGNIMAGGDVKVATASGSVSNQQYQISDARIPTSQIQSQVGTSNNLSAVVGKYEINTVNGAAGGVTAGFGGRISGSPVVSGGSVAATNGGTAIPVAIGSIDVALRNALNTTTTTNPVAFGGDPRR